MLSICPLSQFPESSASPTTVVHQLKTPGSAPLPGPRSPYKCNPVYCLNIKPSFQSAQQTLISIWPRFAKGLCALIHPTGVRVQSQSSFQYFHLTMTWCTSYFQAHLNISSHASGMRTDLLGWSPQTLLLPEAELSVWEKQSRINEGWIVSVVDTRFLYSPFLNGSPGNVRVNSAVPQWTLFFVRLIHSWSVLTPLRIVKFYTYGNLN